MSSTAARFDEFPFDRVAAWLAEGEIIPFIGAGASRDPAGSTGGMPDGSTLAKELANEMPGFRDYTIGNLAKVAQFYQNTVFDRSALYEYLHRRLEAEQNNTAPGAVAKMLASIPITSGPLFIITTNYDTLIERAFAEAGKPICVITQNMRDPQTGSSMITLVHPNGRVGQENSSEFQWIDIDNPAGTAFLFKMHGSVEQASPNGADDIIITEDDYVDFMVNSGGNLSSSFPPASLTAAYKKRRFLFLGYSLQDWNFRAFLRMLAIRNALSGRESKRHYAVQLHPDRIEVELWKQRNVNVYDGDLTDFCTQTIASLAGAK
jgi:NAD-dependent SIR2 family protein deacetylase